MLVNSTYIIVCIAIVLFDNIECILVGQSSAILYKYTRPTCFTLLIEKKTITTHFSFVRETSLFTPEICQMIINNKVFDSTVVSAGTIYRNTDISIVLNGKNDNRYAF